MSKLISKQNLSNAKIAEEIATRYLLNSLNKDKWNNILYSPEEYCSWDSLIISDSEKKAIFFEIKFQSSNNYTMYPDTVFLEKDKTENINRADLDKYSNNQLYFARENGYKYKIYYVFFTLIPEGILLHYTDILEESIKNYLSFTPNLINKRKCWCPVHTFGNNTEMRLKDCYIIDRDLGKSVLIPQKDIKTDDFNFLSKYNNDIISKEKKK